MSIKDLAVVDRPREMLQSKGPKALTDEQLIQVIVGSGVKGADVVTISRQIKRLIDIYGYNITLEQLTGIKGVNKATATKLIALFELASRKINSYSLITEASQAVALVPELKNQKQEHLLVLSLDGANRLISKSTASIGTLNSSLVHPREVFSNAIEDRAASIIAIHNHPSGTLEPSQADIEMTERLKQSGKLLGIQLTDHIIVTATSFFSFSEAGKL